MDEETLDGEYFALDHPTQFPVTVCEYNFVWRFHCRALFPCAFLLPPTYNDMLLHVWRSPGSALEEQAIPSIWSAV